MIELPRGVKMVIGQGGLPMVRVETAASEAEIYLQGAHVTHFKRNGEAPLLFLSKESKFVDGVAIRGGVPIIFPWFGAKTGEAAHGFARTMAWELKEASVLANGSVVVKFRLPHHLTPSSKEAEKDWALSSCEMEYLVTVGAGLELELRVRNNSTVSEFTFENCLHTYFTVGNIATTSITGLKGVNYRDKVDNFAEKTETNEAIQITSEVDRVYMDTTSAVEIRDQKLRRTILVEKQDSFSTVVWNPWIEKAKQMSDFGDEEYKAMVCVESGNVGKNRITLKSGETSKLKVKLTHSALLG